MSEDHPLDALPAKAGGLDPRLGGLLSYLAGWISGLVMFFTQRDEEIRFHAAQSIIVLGGLHVFSLLWTSVVRSGFGPGLIGSALFWLLTLLILGAAIALWIFLCVQGFMQVHFKVPMAGNLAEQWAVRQPPAHD